MANPDHRRPISSNEDIGESRASEPHQRAQPDLDPFRAQLIARFPDRDTLLRQAAQSRRRTRTKRVTAAVIAAFAACAVVYLNPAYKTEVMATQSVSPKTWTLADGTHLSLDASSQVTVQWHVRSRELRLERGAAAMDVGQTWRPFSVAVGDVRIHDIGTLFSVRRTDGGTQIVVKHGEVKVVVASQSASLLANQGLVVQDDRLGPVEPVDASAQMAWKDGRLVFDGVSLAEAIAQMQRYQSHRIVIKDSAAARLRLSGQYNIDGLDDMLRALPSVLPVSVTRQMDGSYVIATRR